MEEGWKERVREKRARQGSQEVVTLCLETTTPRHRTHSQSFLRESTPEGELPPARRTRHSAESSRRSYHTTKLGNKYLGKDLRKRSTAPKPGPRRLEPDWQRREVERQERWQTVRCPFEKRRAPGTNNSSHSSRRSKMRCARESVNISRRNQMKSTKNASVENESTRARERGRAYGASKASLAFAAAESVLRASQRRHHMPRA